MNPMVKICGLTDREGLAAAIEGGADMIGFIFCEKGVSRCYMEPSEAAALLRACKPSCAAPFPKIVGVLRDQTDAEIAEILRHVPVDYFQLHGKETPSRAAEIQKLTGKKIIKVFRVAAAEHLAGTDAYRDVADMFLFDTLTNGPTAGGTGLSFDWSLLAGRSFGLPWILAGGLHADNLARAIAQTGAKFVDVSSGVEKDTPKESRRIKDPRKVLDFLRLAKNL